jgi:hypothetical protein
MRKSESVMASVLQLEDEPSRERVLRERFWCSSPVGDYSRPKPIPLGAARSRLSRP